jgi:hypothetical protein
MPSTARSPKEVSALTSKGHPGRRQAQSCEKGEAQRDVDTLLNGRQI